MAVKVENLRLREVLNMVREGTMQLPEFQRDYVWKNPGKKALMESIFNGYPIGSLLLLELDASSPMFAWTTLETIDIENSELHYENNVEGSCPKYLLLDGQQRVTTLSQLILNPRAGSHSWYIDLLKLWSNWVENDEPSAADSIDDWLMGLSLEDFFTNRVLKENPLTELSGRKRLLPFSVLLDMASYREALNGLVREFTTSEARVQNSLNTESTSGNTVRIEELNRELADLKRWSLFLDKVPERLLLNFFDYQVPCVIVSKDMSISGVCKIFTSTNTTGVKLGSFDLCVAKLYPKEVRLKQLFDAAVGDNTLLRAIDKKDRKYLLTYLALKNGVSPKTANLPKVLDAVHFDDWDNSVVEFCSALESLDTYCGTMLSTGTTKFLSYSAFVPSAAKLLTTFNFGNAAGPHHAMQIKKLQCWYFSSAFSQRYGEGTDSKQEQDHKNENSVRSWFSSTGSFEDDMPSWISEDAKSISYADSSSGGAKAKALLSLIALCDPRDFYDEHARIDGSREDFDLHHIFPKSALKNKLIDEGASQEEASRLMREEYFIDSKFNLTFIAPDTNRNIIEDKLPSVYFARILSGKNKAAKASFIQRLDSEHLISERAFHALLRDDYRGFVEARRDRVVKKLEEFGVTNIHTAGESEDDSND